MLPFQIKKTPGRSYNVDLGDVGRVKEALQTLGYYATPSYGMTQYPDEAMFRGIERFQEHHGLTKDGIMKPGGPTANRLGLVLADSGRTEPQGQSSSTSTPNKPNAQKREGGGQCPEHNYPSIDPLCIRGTSWCYDRVKCEPYSTGGGKRG